MPIKYISFQNLLYRKFISPGEHDAKKIAHAVNESLSNFYNWIEGFCYCPPDIISKIYKATGDPDFLNFFLEDTDMMLAPRKVAAPEKSVVEEILDVAASSGSVVAKVQEALKDGRVNEIEKKRIVKAIDMAEKELEDARKVVGG